MSTTVAIDRLRCRYRVRAGHPAPWEVRARLDRVAQEQVPAQCRALLAGALPEDENGVLIIRRLDLRLILRAGLPDDARIGALWSRALTTAIARVVAADGGDRLARFESWGAYLAHFVADAAQGTAWERWYYRPFGPLRGLSTSAAIREALRIRPQHIISALVALDARGRLPAVTATLTEADARAVFDAIEPAGHGAAEASGAELATVLRAWPGVRAGRPWAAALELAAHVALEAGAPLSFALRDAVRTIARAALLLRDHADLLAAGRWLELRGIAAGYGGEVVAAYHALAAQAPSLADALRTTGAAASSPAETESRMATPYGGLFLLLPTLAEIDLGRLLTDAGVTADLDRLVPVARWLVLLKCLGTDLRAARYDPALALAAGLDTPITPDVLRALARATAGRRREAKAGPHPARPTARHPLPPAGEGPSLLGTVADGPNPSPAMRERVAEGRVRARPASPTHPLSAALVAWALRTRLTDGRERVTERVQVAEGRWVALTRDPASGLWLDVAPGRRSGHRPPADAPEGLPLAMAELAWFLTPDLLPDRRADLAWSHVAAVALHLFARRLTGFGLSSAGYLSRNFLEGASPVERGAAGVTVGLPSVPLHLVLRMSGWGTGRERVPWLPGGTLLIAADQA